MREYVDKICDMTATNGVVIDLGRISLSRGYHDGAVVTPLDFELDKFSGIWFVQFGVALNRRFAVFRLDLGQARFRFTTESDVRDPEAITKNEAEVKRDELIEALDQRFGSEYVNTAASTRIEAMQIWQRLWPCEGSTT
jgi:hypothetical protein